MTTPAPTCFHCGEPIPPGTRLTARVGDAARAVCCIGCRAAAEWIASLGLADYYRLRSEPAARARSGADFAAWDRPALRRLYVREHADGRAEVCVLVQGLRCAACGWLIERALGALPGLDEVNPNLAAKRLQLVGNPPGIALRRILAELARLGFEPQPLNAETLDALARAEQRAALKRLAVAGLGMMQAMMYAVALYAGAFAGMDPSTRDFFRWLGLLVTTPVVLYAGAPFLRGAARELAARRLGMDTPVALAVLLVYLASVIETVRGGAQVYFDSASMFVFLLLAARYLEMRSRHRAADVVDALARLQPALAARRTASGAFETVGTAELEPGDVIRVAAGGTIAADGELLDPSCRVDESLLTGEATPRLRRAGEVLLAGSTVLGGPVELRVRRIGADTVLSAIVRLVGRAGRQRPRWLRDSDVLAARFVGGVLLLAALTAAFWTWADAARAFPAALAVLVVACPCAFALAVPAATTRATAVLARCGVLVVKADALEKLTRITRLVFDKTGTLTDAQPELCGVETFGGWSEARCLRIAAALEAANPHPIAHALRTAARGRPPLHASALEGVVGAGVEGVVEGRHYRLGQRAFALDATAGDDADDGVWLADASGACAHFQLRERLRADAATTVAALRADGIEPEIASGDDAGRVAAIARRLGIAVWRARVTPAAKLARLAELRAGGAVVGAVGDGINDAPVLAGADLAIALGGGADLAQASADLVLAGDRLGALIDGRRIAAHTVRILRQNLRWALVYNFTSIPLAAAGLVPPWLAAIGMSLSSLAVVLNSLRIRVPRPAVPATAAAAPLALPSGVAPT